GTVMTSTGRGVRVGGDGGGGLAGDEVQRPSTQGGRGLHLLMLVRQWMDSEAVETSGEVSGGRRWTALRKDHEEHVGKVGAEVGAVKVGALGGEVRHIDV